MCLSLDTRSHCTAQTDLDLSSLHLFSVGIYMYVPGSDRKKKKLKNSFSLEV
jgi:hypothetical protein